MKWTSVSSLFRESYQSFVVASPKLGKKQPFIYARLILCCTQVFKGNYLGGGVGIPGNASRRVRKCGWERRLIRYLMTHPVTPGETLGGWAEQFSE